MNKVLIAVAGLSFVAGLSPVLAQNATPSGGSKIEGGPGTFAKGGQQGQRALSPQEWQRRRDNLFGVLTPDQRPKVEKMMKDSHEKSLPLLEKINAIQESAGKGIDDKKREELVGLREQVRTQHKQVWDKIRTMLTPEQKARLEASRSRQ